MLNNFDRFSQTRKRSGAKQLNNIVLLGAMLERILTNIEILNSVEDGYLKARSNLQAII